MSYILIFGPKGSVSLNPSRKFATGCRKTLGNIFNINYRKTAIKNKLFRKI